ncbi:MAG: diguanylate cyclase [Planctomycetes bacterium]|nr:diguanylate cyclase [Planctomycetota bacterium]
MQGERRWTETAFPVNRRVLAPAVAVLVVAIFAVDYFEPNLLALASLYAVPILISLWLGSTRITVSVAIASAILAAVGVHASLPPAAVDPSAVANAADAADPNSTLYLVANRVAAVFTIGVVTVLALWRLRVERKLFDTREAVMTTLESIAEGVIATDVNDRVSFMNPLAEQLIGVKEVDAIGKPLDQVLVVVDERAPRPPIIELARRRDSASNDGNLIARNGKRVPISQTRSAIRATDGELHGHVIVFRDITEQREHEEAMARMAYRDTLTGLPNRVSLSDRMTLELAHARRNRELLAVCYVDLDGFKQVNDKFGHDVGDQYLKAIAERLRGALRAGDTIARLGGDEFVILLPGLADLRDAQLVARKVLDALSTPIHADTRAFDASASIGIALFPNDGTEPDTLMRRADKAMYRAKAAGGSRAEFATERSQSGKA